MLTLRQITGVLRFKQSLQRVREAKALGYCPYRDCNCKKPHFKDAQNPAKQEA